MSRFDAFRPACAGASLALALGVSLGPGCASTSTTAESGEPAERLASIDDAVRHGRLAEAVQRASALAADRPDDALAQTAHRDATVAYHLGEARSLSFIDEDDAALAEIEAALAIDPESPEARVWRQRVLEKLAERWYRLGRDAYAQGEFENAEASYERALGYVPEHERARASLDELAEHLVWRDERSADNYNQGVRSRVNGEISLSRTKFGHAKKYEDTPAEEVRIERRIAETEAQLALRWMTKAEEQAATGYWRSALRATEQALSLDAEVDGGERMREVYEREADAAVALRTASFKRLKGDYDGARELLRSSIDATEHQREAFEKELVQVEEDEGKGLYQLALDLEYDYRLEEAVETLDLLLSKRDSFEDAIARRDRLKDNIALAATLYDEARNTSDRDEKRKLLEQIEVLWSGYRDVRDQLDRLGS